MKSKKHKQFIADHPHLTEASRFDWQFVNGLQTPEEARGLLSILEKDNRKHRGIHQLSGIYQVSNGCYSIRWR